MDAWDTLKTELLTRTFYLVNRSGPTVFSIRDEEGKIYRVIIGNPHRCSCQSTHTSQCIHMMYIILKVLRIPESNDLCKRIRFNDGEIERILDGHYEAVAAPVRVRRAKPSAIPTDEAPATTQVTRHDISDSDICPICQDDMCEKDALTWCRDGCGNNLHAKCMKMFAQFKISAKTPVLCPFCRTDWGSSVIATLNSDLRQKLPQNPCAPVSCDACHSTIHGRFLRCVPCSLQKDYMAAVLHKHSTRKCTFCSECATAKNVGKEHQGHNFLASQSQAILCDAEWSTVENPFTAAHTAQNFLMRQLQYREISDSDYHDLLALEQNGQQNLPSSLLQALHYAPPTAPCSLCSCTISSPTASMKMLPCTHTVHASCMEKAIQDALATGCWKLDAIKCKVAECSYRCVFRGISRRRIKNKLQPVKTETSEQEITAGPMRLVGLGIGGSEVLPVNPIGMNRSRMNISSATSRKIHHIRTNTQSSRSASMPSRVDMSIGNSLSMKNGAVEAPRGAVKLPRIAKGSMALRNKTSSRLPIRQPSPLSFEFSVSGSGYDPNAES